MGLGTDWHTSCLTNVHPTQAGTILAYTTPARVEVIHSLSTGAGGKYCTKAQIVNVTNRSDTNVTAS